MATFKLNGGTQDHLQFVDKQQCFLIKYDLVIFQLYDLYDTIAICCGLRANDLLKDSLVRPIKGQAIRVSAPWLKHFVMDEEFYIIPGYLMAAR